MHSCVRWLHSLFECADFAAYEVQVRLTTRDVPVASRVQNQQCNVAPEGTQNTTLTYNSAFSCELGSQKCSRAKSSSKSRSCSTTSCEYIDNDPDECAAPLHDSCMGYMAMDSSAGLRSRVGVWLPCWVYGPNPQRTTYTNPRTMLNPPTYQLWLAAVIVLAIALCCVCRCAGKAAHNRYKLRQNSDGRSGYAALADASVNPNTEHRNVQGAATAVLPPTPSASVPPKAPSSTWEGVFPFADSPLPPTPVAYPGAYEQPKPPLSWEPQTAPQSTAAPGYPYGMPAGQPGQQYSGANQMYAPPPVAPGLYGNTYGYKPQNDATT